MRHSFSYTAALLAGGMLAVLPATWASAQDSKIKTKAPAKAGVKARASVHADAKSTEKPVAESTLLEAMSQGLVSVQAEGTGDGRINMSVTNKTSRPLRVILPPGIVAQGATGQFGGMGGGMGGMGGGMGGMGGGGMGGMGGGGMGGMGGGGMGGGGMGGQMGGAGRSGGTMPPMMGMMMLSNIIMYFCGDFESWDRRSLMMGMGGGGMMGGMGGMGGGMMGGMGGGMRSVPPADLPFADLKPKQTRHLPTSIVSLTNPNGEDAWYSPGKGRSSGSWAISHALSDDPQVQKALRRLAGGLAPASVSQLVMWRLASGLDWTTIGQLSDKWANRYELTLAKDFVEQLGTLPRARAGGSSSRSTGSDAANESMAAGLGQLIEGKTVLGLQRRSGSRRSGSARRRLPGASRKGATPSFRSPPATVSLGTGCPPASSPLPVPKVDGKFDKAQFADSLAEGILNRLVSVQLRKGPRRRVS